MTAQVALLYVKYIYGLYQPVSQINITWLLGINTNHVVFVFAVWLS